MEVEVRKQYYSFGKLLIKYSFVNNQKHGILYNYKMNGTMFFVRQFVKGSLHGIDVTFRYGK